ATAAGRDRALCTRVVVGEDRGHLRAVLGLPGLDDRQGAGVVVLLVDLLLEDRAAGLLRAGRHADVPGVQDVDDRDALDDPDGARLAFLLQLGRRVDRDLLDRLLVVVLEVGVDVRDAGRPDREDRNAGRLRLRERRLDALRVERPDEDRVDLLLDGRVHGDDLSLRAVLTADRLEVHAEGLRLQRDAVVQGLDRRVRDHGRYERNRLRRARLRRTGAGQGRAGNERRKRDEDGRSFLHVIPSYLLPLADVGRGGTQDVTVM